MIFEVKNYKLASHGIRKHHSLQVLLFLFFFSFALKQPTMLLCSHLAHNGIHFQELHFHCNEIYHCQGCNLNILVGILVGWLVYQPILVVFLALPSHALKGTGDATG